HLAFRPFQRLPDVAQYPEAENRVLSCSARQRVVELVRLVPYAILLREPFPETPHGEKAGGHGAARLGPYRWIPEFLGNFHGTVCSLKSLSYLHPPDAKKAPVKI